MERMKRAVCLLLCLVMVVGILPMTAFAADNEVSDTGNLVGGSTYVLAESGVTAGKQYLIVNTNSGTGYALTNNNDGTAGRTEVSISNDTIVVEDDTYIAWTFSDDSSAAISNNGRFLSPGSSPFLNTTSVNLTVNERSTAGQYRLYRSVSSSYGQEQTYYVRYNNNAWSGSTSTNGRNIYLYELTSSSNGDAVEFTLSSSGNILKPGDTEQLGYTVTVAEAAANSQSITWTSSDNDIATVDNNGVVTAVADGTVTITATLTAANGTALQQNIVLTRSVTVQSKAVASGVLSGNTPVIVKVNGDPDFSKMELAVTYDDDSTDSINGEALTVSGYDISQNGTYIATVSYLGKQYGTVVVTVVPDYPSDTTTEYPQFPNPGAVRLDKTATANAQEFKRTGVTHIELDVAGVSVQSAVDVILIMDISNSMSWDDTKYDYNDTAVTAGTSQRLNIARASAKQFVNTLLADDGETEMNNSVTVLAFAGIDGDYNSHSTASDNDDVYQLGELAMTSIDDAEAALDKLVKATTGGTNYDYAFQQAYALAEQLHSQRGNDVHIVFMTDGVPTHYNGVYYKSRNNTDLTAMMRYQAPGVTYDDLDDLPLYVSDGTDTADSGGTDIDSTDTQNITVYYNDGTTATKNVTYNKGWSDYVTGNKNEWAEAVKDLDYVAKVYSIGFGMKNGSVTQRATTSMPTLSGVNGGTYYIPYSTTKTVLEHVSSSASDYYEAENEEDLTALYKSLATKIRYAGTQAQVTDVIDSEFTLQMASFSGSGEDTADLGANRTITVKAYELVTSADIGKDIMIDGLAVTVTADMVGKTYKVGGVEVTVAEEDVGTVMLLDDQTVTVEQKHLGLRKDTDKYPPTEIETVTFNADGTVATSTKLDSANIISGSGNTLMISAKYFTYTNVDGVETFTWTIGNITDKEVTLAYDVYLKGALEGDAEEDVYDTNEYATLEYVDIDGKYVSRNFPVPVAVWGGATTTIRFYLVNAQGQPVNHQGEVVSEGNYIYVGDPVTVALNLNASGTIDAQKIEAAAHVPDEYFLYDNNAYYTVQTASGTGNTVVGGITLSEPSEDAFKTTQDDKGNETTQTGAQTTVVLSAEQPYYTWSYVGFGVRYDLSKETVDTALENDIVVLDYGKDIQVDVLANDTEEMASGFSGELHGFVVYNANTDTHNIMMNPGSSTYTVPGVGQFSIATNDDGKKVVNFELYDMLDVVQNVFCVIKVTEDADPENYYYLYEALTVIPATSVYYETDFADGVFEFTTSGTDWDEEPDETAGENADDNVQNDGTIGQNTYGYDTTYNDDAFLSDGDSWFVEGQGYTANTSSTTDPETGKPVDTTTYDPKTYVLFSFRGTGFDLISRTGAQQGLIKVEVFSDAARTESVKTVSVLNKSESNLELYQIPVVSINELPYDTYYVRVAVDAAYTYESTNPTLVQALSRGGEFYFDAIRVFDPAKGDTVAEAAYAADGEANRQLAEVRALLLSTETYLSLNGTTTGMLFIDRTQDDVQVVDYSAIGPNNEAYLSKDEAIAFKMGVNTVPASFDLGVKSIVGNTAGLKVTVTNGTDSWVIEKSVSSSTAQNIDLLDSSSYNSNVFGANTYVVIENTADGVLSITDLKVAYSSAASAAAQNEQNADNGIMLTNLYAADAASVMTVAEETEVSDPYAVSYTVDAATFEMARTVLTAPETPEEEIPEETEPEVTEPETTEPEETEPETTEPETEVTEPETEPEATEPEVSEPVLDIIKVSANTKGSLFNRKTTFTVVTTQDVASLKVAQMYWFVSYSSATYQDLDNGTRVWTVQMPTIALGAYTITAYGADGTRGDSASVMSWGL